MTHHNLHGSPPSIEVVEGTVEPPSSSLGAGTSMRTAVKEMSMSSGCQWGRGTALNGGGLPVTSALLVIGS